MRLGSLFVLLSLLSGLYAFWLPGRGWALLWVSASLMVVGLGYLALGPGVFGKRPDGTMALWSTILLLPYLLYVWGIWRLYRLLSRRSPYQELIPGIIIGRRLSPSEYPKDIDSVLDLTCEFPEFKGVREAKDYRCFPILDGHVPKLRELVGLIRELNDVTGALYIHCAAGYGRTGIIAAAILLARGLATDPSEAIRMVRARRPGIRLRKKCQREVVAELAKALAPNAGITDHERRS